MVKVGTINKIGFLMSGGVDAYVNATTSRRFRAVATVVYFTGAIRTTMSSTVGSPPNVVPIVPGTSSRANIESTVGLVNSVWPSPTSGLG